MLKKVNPKSNMYQFITHCWSPISGRCEHDCSYCYVKRFPVGPLRLREEEFKTFHGKGNFIFVCSGVDLFQNSVPTDWILRVLNECRKYPENKYLFQTKNPGRFFDFDGEFPINCVLGTTIETNRYYPISKAPKPEDRMKAMVLINKPKMVTCEPLCDFDLDILVDWLKAIKPEWINIGADSNKEHKLIEPTAEQVKLLVEHLRAEGLIVKIKGNLRRLTGIWP